jgi:hypothetical protein
MHIGGGSSFQTSRRSVVQRPAWTNEPAAPNLSYTQEGPNASGSLFALSTRAIFLEAQTHVFDFSASSSAQAFPASDQDKREVSYPLKISVLTLTVCKEPECEARATTTVILGRIRTPDQGPSSQSSAASTAGALHSRRRRCIRSSPAA